MTTREDSGNIDKLSEMHSTLFKQNEKRIGTEVSAKNFEKSLKKVLTKLARCAKIVNVRHLVERRLKEPH